MINQFVKRVKQIIHSNFDAKTIHFLRKYYFFFRLKGQKIFEEEEDLKILPKIIKPNHVVVDIGANIGLYTVFISRLLTERGRILAFEPIPETYDILANNVRKLCRSKATAFRFCLSNKKGYVKMIVPDGIEGVQNYYLSHMQPINKVNCEGNMLEVEVQTLDNMQKRENCRIDFIKCDAEGAELLVFQGGRKTIDKFLPLIMCEISCGHDRYGYVKDDIFKYLWNYGYLSYTRKNNALTKCTGFIKGYPNYFFIHPTKIEYISSILRIE